MESIRNNYRSWLDDQLDLGKNTKKSYFSVLYGIEFSGPEEFIRSVKQNKERSMDKTYNLLLSSLIKFRSFVEEQDHDIKDWFVIEVSKLKRLRHTVSESYPPYSKEEVKLILENAKGWRKQVLWIALTTGLRKSEIEALNIQDIDLDAGVIKVLRGKGNKSRQVVLSDISQLLIWKSKREAIGVEGPHWIFSGWGSRANLSSGNIFSNLSKKIGITVQLHRRRSTYATLLYGKSLDVKLVQFQLGHSSSNVTDKYIQRSLKSIKKQMENIGRLF